MQEFIVLPSQHIDSMNSLLPPSMNGLSPPSMNGLSPPSMNSLPLPPTNSLSPPSTKQHSLSPPPMNSLSPPFNEQPLLSQTIPTTLPTIPYPGTILPQHSQPQGHPSPIDPSPLYFHHHDTLSRHHYLLLSCYFIIPCFIISLILPCTCCPSPGYLVHLS